MSEAGQIEIEREHIDRVCHELLKPLAAMRAFTEILSDEISGPVNSDQRDHLDVVLRNSDRMGALIGDFYDLAESQSGAIDLDLRTCDLEALCHAVQDQYGPRFEKQGTRLTFRTSGPLQHERVDARRLSDVLGRLLDNCLRFAAEGDVVVSLDRFEGAARIEVLDEGPGLPVEELEQIFEPFYRSAGGRAVTDMGMGVGLAICRQVVSALGGSIRATNRPLDGMCVTIALPLNSPDPSPVAPPRTKEHEGRDSRATGRVGREPAGGKL